MESQVLRRIKNIIAVATVVLVLFAIAVPENVSGIESREELIYGNVVQGLDYCDAGLAQDIFHQQTLSMSDNEALGISFPVTTVQGPGGKTSQVISPVISQTSNDAVTATSTGLYEAASDTCPGINFGAAPVGVGMFAAPIPVTRAQFSTNALMYPEMVVQGNLPDATGPDISLPPAQAGVAYNTIMNLAGKEENMDAVGFDARDEGLPVVLSGRTIDTDSTPDQINQTGIVERLWRNTHQGNVMDYVFEGEVARPRWIMPVKNPLLLLGCGCGTDSIKESLMMTRPGRYLTRSFWSI
jgi:hypothetical protein